MRGYRPVRVGHLHLALARSRTSFCQACRNDGANCISSKEVMLLPGSWCGVAELGHAAASTTLTCTPFSCRRPSGGRAFRRPRSAGSRKEARGDDNLARSPLMTNDAFGLCPSALQPAAGARSARPPRHGAPPRRHGSEAGVRWSPHGPYPAQEEGPTCALRG